MTQEQQKIIIDTISKYNNSDNNTIKNNITRLLKPYKALYVAEALNIDVQTVYAWQKKKGGNKPNILTALELCQFLGITISDLMVENTK